MPAISNLVLNDGQATPVAHTFEPARTTADFAQWEDRVSGVYVGFWKLVQQLVRPKGDSKVANRNLKSMHKIETPVMETLGTSDTGLTPPPTIAHRPFVDINFTFSERASKQNRKDLRVLAANYLVSAAAIAAIDDLGSNY